MEQEKKSSIPVAVIIIIAIIIMIPICGIIAAIAIPSFIRYRNKSIEKLVITNAEILRDSVEVYRAKSDQDVYPSNVDDPEFILLENPINEYEQAIIVGDQQPPSIDKSLEGCIYYYLSPDKKNYIIVGYGLGGEPIITIKPN